MRVFPAQRCPAEKETSNFLTEKQSTDLISVRAVHLVSASLGRRADQVEAERPPRGVQPGQHLAHRVIDLQEVRIASPDQSIY